MLSKITFLLSFLVTLQSWADFKVPALTGPVVDRAGVISPSAQRWIESVSKDFWNSGKAQIQVLTVPSLEGETIESASIKVVDTWKLGTQKGDNGILLMVALQERRMRIEVGQGLEGVIPDAIAKRIIAEVMTPFFRQGDYSTGILAGVAQIAGTIDQDYKSQALPEEVQAAQANQNKSRARGKSGGLSNFIFLILIIGFIFLRFIFGGAVRRHGIGRGPWGGGGFGGGGFGGGGGWSGGGGGFSGGGSSGSW